MYNISLSFITKGDVTLCHLHCVRYVPVSQSVILAFIHVASHIYLDSVVDVMAAKPTSELDH
jgi:hypothetical protein